MGVRVCRIRPVQFSMTPGSHAQCAGCAQFSQVIIEICDGVRPGRARASRCNTLGRRACVSAHRSGTSRIEVIRSHSQNRRHRRHPIATEAADKSYPCSNPLLGAASGLANVTVISGTHLTCTVYPTSCDVQFSAQTEASTHCV